MPCTPMDPRAWDASPDPELSVADAATETILAMLNRLPESRQLHVAVLGTVDAELRDLLAERVTRLTCLPALDGPTAERRFDSVVIDASVATADDPPLDATLARAHGLLVEGGVLLAGFRAASRVAGRVELRLHGAPCRADRPVHEVELQYRLHRAGFQGVRIRRYPAGPPSEGLLLVMAVRRAHN